MKARRSKYGAVKTTVRGVVFDSAKESRRYEELCILQQAGDIRGLALQPKFPFYVNDKPIFVYKADFCYIDNATGQHVVEDVKGFKTPVYRLKKKLIEAQRGIKITEV